MDMGAENGTGRIVEGIENCTCPVGYKGMSCETCDYGYIRKIDPLSLNVICKKCNCHNHSPECDQISSNCSVKKNTKKFKTAGTHVSDVCRNMD